jgi:hypothetical protein
MAFTVEIALAVSGNDTATVQIKINKIFIKH